ncbi:hypothetical protein NLG97_g6653 [Lecanicillium saksenae]|uniref:Uncharacterized protein n=1 Tax=Lecanicillium saksenae TaxID=468837 RepID=A0ACC1QRC6_9HYPO|nr:hypothetical protein NLG97_g6653 [Lecanicillium saksenae]
MQFFVLALTFAPAISALLIDSPADLPAGGKIEITWTEDPVEAVFYFTEDGNPPLFPVAVASTFANKTEAKMPKTKATGGYIVAYSLKGEGPIGRSSRIPVRHD